MDVAGPKASKGSANFLSATACDRNRQSSSKLTERHRKAIVLYVLGNLSFGYCLERFRGAADAAIRSPGAVSHGDDEVDGEIYEERDTREAQASLLAGFTPRDSWSWRVSGGRSRNGRDRQNFL